MRRFVVVAAIVAMVASGQPVGAGGDSAGSAGDTIWVNPINDGSSSPGSSGANGGGGPSECDYQVAPEDPTDLDQVQGVKVIDGVTHYLFFQDCLNGLPIGAVWVPEVRPEDLIPTVEAMLEERLPSPTPLLEPLDAEFGWAYVQVPLDFRVAAEEWQPVEAYAEVTNPLGTVWVRGTAEPVELLLLPGDPRAAVDAVRCDGDGPIAPYDPAIPGPCSIIFQNSSSTSANGRTFPGSISIAWSGSWVSSDPAAFGALDVGPTETLFDLAVAEAKALVACTGSTPNQGGC